MASKITMHRFRCFCSRVLPTLGPKYVNNVNGKLFLRSNTRSLSSTKPFLTSDSNLQTRRHLSSSNQSHPQVDQTNDPYQLVEGELSSLCDDIKLELATNKPTLRDMVHYHFDGEGKSFRPMLVLLLAKLINRQHGSKTNDNNSYLLKNQKKVAQIAEMIHVASLVHDDVIDASDTRRGKPSVHAIWGQQQAITAGDYILARASMALARIGHPDVVSVLAQVVEDLVKGEFMQLGTKEKQNDRFTHYLRKTYKKTASLMANSCKAVAILADVLEKEIEMAYEIGRNIGVAFQLVDDMLDFISSDQLMGKPTAADLKLGLATAPVLFAADKHPELHGMIMRRFKNDGDVEHARKCVTLSDGVQQTRLLAETHCQEAVRLLKYFQVSPERTALIRITDMVLSRNK